MTYKVSKDYKRLKQLLDEGNKVICFIDYGFDRNIPLINLSIIRRVSYGQILSYKVSNFEYMHHSLVISNDSLARVYGTFECHNVQFIDPDYERNTLKVEYKNK